MSRIAKFIGLSAIAAIIVVGGCATKPVAPANGQQVAISTSLKQLGVGSEVSRVSLTVRGSDFPSASQDLTLTNGAVRAEIDVPFGTNRIFELTAYDGETVLYFGADTADVSAGVVTEVFVYLRPQVPMIKISPLYSSRNNPGLNGTFNVEVHNIDSLFGISFRLEVDTSIIQFTSAEAGDFLGSAENTLFFVQTYPQYLAVGYTLRGNREPQGVSGSGTVANVFYNARRVGRTAVTINPAYLRLIDWQGNPLPRQGRIYIESGEVEVLAQ